VLKWTPNGQRGIGRPKNTWKIDAETVMKAVGFKYMWKKLETAALD